MGDSVREVEVLMVIIDLLMELKSESALRKAEQAVAIRRRTLQTESVREAKVCQICHKNSSGVINKVCVSCRCDPAVSPMLLPRKVKT